MTQFLSYTNLSGVTEWIAVDDISCLIAGEAPNTTNIYLKSAPQEFTTAQGSPHEVIHGDIVIR